MADPAQHHHQIERLLEEIARTPTDFTLYKELRSAALKHKAAGGRDLDVFAKVKLKIEAADPLQRLVNALRLWAFDPGDSDHVVSTLQSLQNYARSEPCSNIEPLQRWLQEIIVLVTET